MQQQAAAAYTVTVTDSGDAGASAAAGTPTQTLSRAAAQQITVSWQAEDPDGDRLVYNLYFRGDEERRWMLLKGDLHDNSFTFDSDVLADGKYYFRVVASDREVNPPATAREADLTSAPVMIDNTPPVVTIGPVHRAAATAEIELRSARRRFAAAPLRVFARCGRLGADGSRRWGHRFPTGEVCPVTRQACAGRTLSRYSRAG